MAFSLATIGNIRAQYVIWGVNVVVPLMVAPYVNRILGPAGVGVYAFCQAFAAYPALFIDFGFQMGGVRAAAIYSKDVTSQRQHVWASLYLKLIVTLVVLPVAVLAALAFPIFRSPVLCVLMLLLAVSTGLSFEWHFRGVEDLQTAARWSLLGRVLTVPLTFLFVTEASHVDRLLLIAIAGNAVVTVALCNRALRRYPKTPFRGSEILVLLREQTPFVLIQLIQSVGASLTVILTMQRLGEDEAGYWATAQRIQGPFWALWAPFLTATFPAVVSDRLRNGGTGKGLAKRVTTIVFLGAAGSAIVLAVLAGPIVRILGGPAFEPAIPTLRLLAFYIPLLALTSSLTSNYMMVDRLDKWIVPVSAVSAAGTVIILVGTAEHWGHSGAALSLIGGEVIKCVLSVVVIMLHRKGIVGCGGQKEQLKC